MGYLRSGWGLIAAGLVAAAPAPAQDRTFFPPQGRPAGVPADARPPFSAAVLVGDTLYLAGSIDLDPATGKPAATVEGAARASLDGVRRSVEAAGMTMDELVWVQVFATDPADFATFGRVYETYFHGPLPARSFVGVDKLMGGARFEVTGIAVRRHTAEAKR
jgi:2-iminobutanoate/2-iminopropanoate deaminase